MKFNLTYSRKTLAWVLIALVIFVIITITGIFLIINEGFATTPLIFFILGALGIFVCALALANYKKPYSLRFEQSAFYIDNLGRTQTVDYLTCRDFKIFRQRSKNLGEKVDERYVFGTYKNPQVLCEDKIWRNGEANHAILALELLDGRLVRLPNVKISQKQFDEMKACFDDNRSKAIETLKNDSEKLKIWNEINNMTLNKG